MASDGEDSRRKTKLFLDPEKDREEQKKRLVDTIDKQMEDVDRADIEDAITEKYDPIIEDADVKKHVPTLAEGQAKMVLRDRKKGAS